MMTLDSIFKAQQKYGVTQKISDMEQVSYEIYLSSCRKYISDLTPSEYYNWDRQKQIGFTENLIVQYVNSNQKEVEGFVQEGEDGVSGELMITELITRLETDIVDFGILRPALDDPDIQEIQINDFKTIWVVKHGRAELYCDRNGKPYQFVSDEELHSVIDRLVFNNKTGTKAARMTVTNPLVNTRTAAKGFRLSAVNDSATTPDMKAGFDFPVTTVTIRKYSPSRLTFDDFVRFGTMTEEMAQFLRLCGSSNVRLACVGPTSSGKTTLLNAVVWEIPRDQRLLLVQNPTEIMVYERAEETGVNLRNSVHWEASDLSPEMQKDPTTATMANFISHALRNTPDVLIPGEVRTPEEFFQMNRAIKTGHRVLTTFHASSAADAIERMATELATLGGSIQDYVSSLVRSIDIVVAQLKLPDGRRRVVSIEELTGEVDENGKAKSRVLFRFRLTGQTERDEYGNILEVKGVFEQPEAISDELVQKFYQAGVSEEELRPYVDLDYKGSYQASNQSYTGMSDEDFMAGLSSVQGFTQDSPLFGV